MCFGDSPVKGGREVKLCLEEEVINLKTRLDKGGVSRVCRGFSMFFSSFICFTISPFPYSFIFPKLSFTGWFFVFFFPIVVFLLAAFARTDFEPDKTRAVPSLC